MRKSNFFLIFFALFFANVLNAAVLPQNAALSQDILSKMENFCQDAGGTVTVFPNSCADSCILYDRKTGQKIPENQVTCEKKEIYSCKCPQNMCLKENKCQNIIINK